MWWHLLWSCSSSLMVGIKAWCCHILPDIASQQSFLFRVAHSVEVAQMAAEDLAGFWLMVMSPQLFNIKPFMNCVNSQVHKRTFCINLVLYGQNMTCPSCLYSFYCSRNADNFQACPKFTYSTLCSCLYKGVFLQFRDIFWKKKEKWEAW